MCNEYEQLTGWDEYEKLMADLAIVTGAGSTPSSFPVEAQIGIGDLGPALIATGNGTGVESMRFGFPPKGKGGPVFNFRSDGRSFEESARCVILASAFFEFTGTKYPKAKHRFFLPASPIGIAGIWRDATGGPAFTMLTTEPGPDIAPYHNRQIVVLPPALWSNWLYLTRSQDELLQPAPAGTLSVETIREGSD